jgi:hypothetical protein
MFSPYAEPYLVNSDIGKIHVPLMYQGGTTDLMVTPAVKRPGGAYDSSNPPKYFLEIQKAGHMAWSNTVCKGYSTVSVCLASDDMARVIDAYGIAFFDRYLKSRQRPVVLTQKDPSLSEYRYQE